MQAPWCRGAMWRGAAAGLLCLAAAWLLSRGFEPRARLLRAAELRRYRGAPGEPGLYLALLGRVFDVERGRKHYGPGGAYSGLAGTCGGSERGVGLGVCHGWGGGDHSYLGHSLRA